MTPTELGEVLHRGSDACALDELPRALLLRTGGIGHAVVASLLAQVDGGGELLCTVLHLPLAKKEPSWLIRNSRPVLLEACAKRAEATVQFHRLVYSLECEGSMASEMYAYRRQLPGTLAAMTVRWLLVWWVSLGYVIRVLDWDESNAYCNIPRQDLEAALGSWCPGLGLWALHFYVTFLIRIATARGLTAVYLMQHGCGQGDSGGVGVYTALGILRTAFHRGVLRGGLWPRDLTGGALCLNDVGLPLPMGGMLTEIAFSDDRRLFSSTKQGLARLVGAVAHGCWASGGCANADKLLLFRVQLCGSRMVYGVDTPVLTDLGPLPVGKRGLRLTGVPLVSGEIWAAPIDKAVRRLHLICAGIHRLRPTYVLALCIVLGSYFSLVPMDDVLGGLRFLCGV